MTKVAVIGTGYVGCVTAACMSRDGHEVIGVDIDAEKVAAINAGDSPVSEPGLGELVRQEVARGSLRATEDLDEAIAETQVGLISVGTPSDATGGVSAKAVERVMRAVGESLRDNRDDYTVVVRSTLLPGILEEWLAPLLYQAAGCKPGERVRLCNNPEFLRESAAINDYDAPPFVVVGTLEGDDAEEVLKLYDKIPGDRIVTDSRTAALLKYSCNAYHAAKIAFANEIGSLAKAFGADGQQVMEMVCRDKKLNISEAYLRPAFSFGGSCLPKDLRALVRYAEQEALHVSLLRSVLPSNQEHFQRAVRMIEERGVRKIGMVGLSFKAGTDDLRESPYVTLTQTLIGRGYEIKIYDPGFSISRLKGRNLAYVQQHLPHLAALLLENPARLFEHAELLVFGNDVADELKCPASFQDKIVDLRSCLVVPES